MTKINLASMTGLEVTRMTRRQVAKLTLRQSLEREVICAEHALEINGGESVPSNWNLVDGVKRAKQALADCDAGVVRYHSYPVGFFAS